ncbi:DUF2920 family protein [Campylobacter jejuni]|nr:DUF2920 family protein [Campylobacter jejuni]QMX69121.1 DUF2920 family protein [Campylobacter jejuni]
MQNLLLYIKNNLTPTLAQILLQALKNSNNENFFTFVLKNIETICTWLNSNEFRDRYLSTKHPYPPLINPNFIEIDSSRHCAELAWDLNLPLPKHYKFIYISPHGVGAAAFLRYLNQCCDVTCFASWVLPPDSKERYCINYMCLNDNTIAQYAINISEINLPYFDKYLSLLDFNSKIICGVRDPIGLLKHSWGRDWSKVLRNYPPEFNLTYDWRYYINYLTHQNHKIKIDINELQQGVFIISYLLKYFNKDNVYYLDMEEIRQSKAFDTMNLLAINFNFTPPNKLDLFKIKNLEIRFRTILFGNSYGGYLANLCAKIAPWSIDFILDNSSFVNLFGNIFRLIGFGKEIDFTRYHGTYDDTLFKNIFLYLSDKTYWNNNKFSKNYFSNARKIIREPLNKEHLIIQSLYPNPKYILYHSIFDERSPFKNKENFVHILKELNFKVEFFAISQVDNKFIKNLNHGMGLSTKLFFKKHLLQILKEPLQDKICKKEVSYKCDELVYTFKEENHQIILNITN